VGQARSYIGETLGGYQVVGEIGRGGMGIILRATHVATGQEVALKVMSATAAIKPEMRKRFAREARATRATPHPNIVHVYEAFEHEGLPVIAMELLLGESLEQHLKRVGLLDLGATARIGICVTSAVGTAHAAGIVHRDLKPDNIFLCGTQEGDHAKILDFGSVRDNSAGAKKLTVMGTTIGSPYYMSPEQAQALASLDHRADVWSLAAIAFECLTGKLPFQGSSGPAILLSILTDDPKPPSEVGAAHEVPKTLDAVMEEALAKDPAIRIPSIGAFVDRLGQAYGLKGSYMTWACTPQNDLGAQIRARLPDVLAQHTANAANALKLSMMDAAFRSEDPFKAGSVGGPMAAPFNDDLIMGVPKGRPRWIFAAAVGAAVIFGLVVAILIAR
jgi:serine/threonine-protein kinase